MKRTRKGILGIIVLIALASMSCMLFQGGREESSVADAPPEPVQEEPELPAEETGELIRQWALSATASSSYGDPEQAAIQATGKPNTEGCVDADTAWASEERTGVDWLELRYEKPVYPEQINIYQSHSPNQVTKVELLDVGGTYHTVYTHQPEVMECPYMLTLDIADQDYQAVGVKLIVDQSILDPTSSNEIDAVELVGRYVGGEVADIPPADSPPSAEVPTGDYDLPAISPSSLAPGSFQYVVVGADVDKNVDSDTLQYQSISDEYVIGLISQDTRYSLSLMLPHELNTGTLPLNPYEGGSFKKAPTTAIYIGVHLYVADGGMVLFDRVDDKITGSFAFVAHDQDDPTQVVTVSGVFNAIPLVEK